jgi:tRNA uridine 5-carbamoylmethylation protein Kti12
MEPISVLLKMEIALKKEYGEYQNLLSLSAQQHDILSDPLPDTDQIVSIMDRKMTMINVIQKLESEHKQIKQTWEECHRAFTDEEKRGIAKLREALLSTIERLRDLEDQIIHSIKKCESEINNKLQGLYQGRTANSAYLKINHGPPRYIDKKK